MHELSGTATNLFKVFGSDLRQRLIPLLWEVLGQQRATNYGERSPWQKPHSATK